MLGGAAVAWPLAAQAQQPAIPVVGFLGTTTPDDSADRVAAFRERLKEAGYIDRWALLQYDQLPALAAELVARQIPAGRDHGRRSLPSGW
jgi:putative ABC transport system substrate-binding protein